MSRGRTREAEETLDRAISALWEEIGGHPHSAGDHISLGNALGDRGDGAGAIAEFREALRLRPDYAEAHYNAGHVLRKQGQFAEALAELKRGHELGAARPDWPYPSAEWVRQAERLVKVEKDLPAILAGRTRPADVDESLTVALMCYDRKLHGASARFWSEAFGARPKLADDMQAQHRYNAACAAALAGCGQGKVDPPLDEATKARWRKQAVAWLIADLAAWSRLLAGGPPQTRQSIRADAPALEGRPRPGRPARRGAGQAPRG